MAFDPREQEQLAELAELLQEQLLVTQQQRDDALVEAQRLRTLLVDAGLVSADVAAVPGDTADARGRTGVAVEAVVDCAAELEVAEPSCAICLAAVTETALARTVCRHQEVFHAACLRRWTLANKSCPLCRSEVCELLDYTGEVSAAGSKYYDFLACVVCEQQEDERSMLVCDRCDRGYHKGCLGLGRRSPKAPWYCFACK